MLVVLISIVVALVAGIAIGVAVGWRRPWDRIAESWHRYDGVSRMGAQD